MDKFIHRQNFSLLSRRLADPSLTDEQRKVILTLLTEEQVKARPERAFDPCQSNGDKLSLCATGSQLGDAMLTSTTLRAKLAMSTCTGRPGGEHEP
jgi:hypothetical protein